MLQRCDTVSITLGGKGWRDGRVERGRMERDEGRRHAQ